MESELRVCVFAHAVVYACDGGGGVGTRGFCIECGGDDGGDCRAALCECEECVAGVDSLVGGGVCGEGGELREGELGRECADVWVDYG